MKLKVEIWNISCSWSEWAAPKKDFLIIFLIFIYTRHISVRL